MKVRFLGEDDPLELRHNKIYDVIGVDNHVGWYRIVDETQDDYLFPPENFEIVEQLGAEDGFIVMLEESLHKNIEYTAHKDVVHRGYVENYLSREDNGGRAKIQLKIKDDEIVTVQERDIAEIKIIKYTVMREAFSQLNQEAIAFLYKEFSLTEKEFLAMTEDDLVCLYDKLCDIEHAETPSDDSPLTERGEMVESIITIVGNYFSEKLGYNDDEFDEFEDEEDES